jgi:hypothetical protein
MKRILIAIMFVVGFPAVAQAKIVYLDCDGASVALKIGKNSHILYSSLWNELGYITETDIKLTKGEKFYMIISRLTLDYFWHFKNGKTQNGKCTMGRKF